MFNPKWLWEFTGPLNISSTANVATHLTRGYFGRKMLLLKTWRQALLPFLLFSFAAAGFPRVAACVPNDTLKTPAYGIDLSLDFL